MFCKKMMYGIGFLVLVSAAQAKTPTTQTTVSHPVTEVVVSRPQTDVQRAISRPQTTVAVQRPVTQVPVLKPVTTTTVNQLKTDVIVSHPQTDIAVIHPSSTEFGGGADADYSGQKASQNASQKNVNSVPSSSSPTTMSGFQMPKAKDLKAANLTKGEDGLGRPDDAEKSAEAAAFKLPKAEEATAENLKNLTEKAQSLNKSTLQKEIENKIEKSK